MPPGDPDALGWAITLLYAAAAAACWRAGPGGPWRGVALLLLALGVNKQLDLQTSLIAWGRAASRMGGWYAHRRLAQAVVMALLATAGCVALLLGRRMFAVADPPLRRAIGGVAVLGLFLLLRAGAMLHVPLGGLPSDVLHLLLEGGGLLLILRAALSRAASRRAARGDAR